MRLKAKAHGCFFFQTNLLNNDNSFFRFVIRLGPLYFIFTMSNSAAFRGITQESLSVTIWTQFLVHRISWGIHLGRPCTHALTDSRGEGVYCPKYIRNYRTLGCYSFQISRWTKDVCDRPTQMLWKYRWEVGSHQLGTCQGKMLPEDWFSFDQSYTTII